jgi:hypothetical protein
MTLAGLGLITSVHKARFVAHKCASKSEMPENH